MKKNENYPKHIGIILDGNRRWAKENNLPPWEGHRAGFKKIKDLQKWMIDLDIKELTLYCFSTQNFDRDPKEVFFLMKIFEQAFRDAIKDKDVIKHQIKINHIGRLFMLPKSLQNLIKKAVDVTKGHNNYKVNFAIAYGGQEEIVDAVKKLDLAKIDISKLTPEIFRKYLYLNSYPEIIIRTSGEQRTSNFLIWQQAYSEWFFPKVYWPGFTKNDLKVIIEEYLNRNRRFGK